MRTRHAILMLIAALAGTGGLYAQTSSTEGEKLRAFRAAFVFNFIKFTEWPESSFADDKSPIRVVVVGDAEMAPSLRRVIAGAPVREVHGRQIEVVSLSRPPANADKDRKDRFEETLRTAHVAYVDDSQRDHVDAILGVLDGSDVLTIGEGDHFARRGGMLGLVLRSGKYSIEANPDEVKKTGVRVSSQVFRLAKIVETGPEK